MNKVAIVVNQVTGYYRIDVRITLTRDEEKTIELGLHSVLPIVEQLAHDIRENFAVSDVRIGQDGLSILVKCARRELRKIETWLSLHSYDVKPLKRWKNER